MTAIARAPHELEPADLRIAPGRRRREAMVRILFLGASALSIVISAGIILTLIGNAVGFVVRVDPAALVTEGWFPRRRS